MKQGPLYDAARMLRIAAKRCDLIADLAKNCTYEQAERVQKATQKLVSEAMANIDAASARITPYKR